ncbi:hypothetical protein AB0M42_10180 [Streptomyces sp. NPDC051784]|uniref:hypothetical protein n=1 Tax=Streptomyces sp. NPDC051784 TaxID=3155805 RepID=UPI0034455661
MAGGSTTRGDGTPRSFAATALALLRHHGRHLYGCSARAAGVAALGGLLVTAAGFLIAWPQFDAFQAGAVRARIDEDSYAPDGSRVHTLWIVLLGCLPFLVLLLHLGCAAVQTAASQAHGRFRAVLGVYVLRGPLVWAPLVLGILVEEYFTTTAFRQHTAIVPKWEYPNLFELLRYGPPLLGLAVALALRLGWTLAPATCAAEDLGPWAAMRRSWSLTWGRAAAWYGTAAVALPLGTLTVGAYLLLHAACRPLRSATASLFLDRGPENPYGAYAAGALAPIAAALLLTGALTLPLAHTAFAVLQQRLAQARARDRDLTAAALRG